MENMIKTVLSKEEIELIHLCLNIVENSIDRGDLHDFTSQGDEILTAQGHGMFEGLRKL